ncbi:MAG: peptidoglycan-binding domain-containing protein [Desulfobacteraceae bacterium]
MGFTNFTKFVGTDDYRYVEIFSILILNWEKGGLDMTTMNCSIKEHEKTIYQHKSLHNLKRLNLDIRTFNVLMSIDGKRSVGDISHDLISIDGNQSVEDISHNNTYNQTFLEEKIQLLLKLGLIEPVPEIEEETNLSFFEQPIMNSFRPAKWFDIKQITNRLHNSLANFIIIFKLPLFWCVIGFGLVALLLTSVPMAMKRLKGDATASLLSPAIELDAGHELETKLSNIESKTSKADREQAKDQGKGAVKSTELSQTVSTPPSKVSAARPTKAQPKEIEVDFHNDFKDALALPQQDKAKPLPAKAPAGHLAQKRDDLHNDSEGAMAQPQQDKTKPLPAKAPTKHLAQKFVTASLGKTKRPSESLKKKPPALRLPYLTVGNITSKTRPASEAEFLDYLYQTGPESNWKEILLYASKIWRLEAPMVEKYDYINDYLEYYGKYHKDNGLAIHSAICTLHQLKVFKMLAILEFRHPQQEVSKYLVIKKIDFKKAVLSNGKSEGDIIITHHQLDRFWSGISHIPWKKVIRSADVINTKSPPVAVKELKAYLNSVGFHNLDDPEMYNQRTASAIKQIQTRFGIAPTGVVDVVTHAAFNRYRDRILNQAEPRHNT